HYFNELSIFVVYRGTFYKIWLYPSQVEAWHMVGWGKLGSWYLLLLLSLVLVLKILGHRDNQGNWNLR
ncbi:DUF817 family protein, partial [Acinetobacter baumannii]